MKFSHYANNEEPAFDVFTKCHEIVFKDSDGNTEYLDRLSEEAKLVYLIWCFDGEIHNGGFDQLFFNSLGNHCEEILKYLKLINANKSIELLQKSIKWFPNNLPPSNRAKRQILVLALEDNEEYQDEMEELDSIFYEYEDNLAELLNKYVKSNSQANINV
ncbi:MAG: DMP19 family protein [Pseudomonadales bacterium]|nr:DMP19 family protein [Pseudomonadales bacterium]